MRPFRKGPANPVIGEEGRLPAAATPRRQDTGGHDHGHMPRRYGAPNPKRRVHAGRARESAMITGLLHLGLPDFHDHEAGWRAAGLSIGAGEDLG